VEIQERSSQHNGRFLTRPPKSFALTKYRGRLYAAARMSSADVRVVQTCYPKIYLACHTRHRNAASSATHISARDSAMLSHLDEKRGITPSQLAHHLGVGRPTLSAAVKRLSRLGYIAATADRQDRRRVLLHLTARGAAAMRSSSVLEPLRVERLLAAMTSRDKRLALTGLELLAAAAQRLMTASARREKNGGRRA
jgi:DNA-binding MarR family transcriptional regulator